MKKKVIILSLALMLLLTGVVSAATLWGKYKGFAIMKITVDGSPVKTDVPAIVFDNRTMVPVYLLKEAGISYSLDNAKQTVNISTKSSGTSAFDPTAATKKIMALGGLGVTIMNVSGETTSTVVFPQKSTFDKDWPNIDDIFKYLMDFNSTYSRVEYYSNGQNVGVVEIKTSDYKRFMSGSIDSTQLNDLWIITGPLFNEDEQPVIDYPVIDNSSDTINSKIDGNFEGFENGKLFELTNGQIWKQTSFDISVNFKFQPKVTIYKDGINWYMIVDGVDKKVKVEKLK